MEVGLDPERLLHVHLDSGQGHLELGVGDPTLEEADVDRVDDLGVHRLGLAVHVLEDRVERGYVSHLNVLQSEV